MKLSELLIYLIETASSLNPDADGVEELEVDPEIRIAMQPSWPMENHVGHLRIMNSNAEDIAELEDILSSQGTERGDLMTESERGEAEEELTRLKSENEIYIYIVEGSHIGYAKPTLWDTQD